MDSNAAYKSGNPAQTSPIIVTQNDMHLWHSVTLDMTFEIACGSPKWTATVAAIISSIAIPTIIMLLLLLR